MEGLVYRNQKGGDVTTSLKIAEIFGKRHDNVLRDIKSLDCSKEFRLLNFELMLSIRVLPTGGKTEDEYYEISRDGFSFLVMGYKGEKAGKFKEDFINEFKKREELLLNDDYILARAVSIANNRAKRLEQQLYEKDVVIEEKTKIIELQAPKAEYYDKVISADGLFPITLIAQQINMTARKLNTLLKEKKIQRKLSCGTWVLNSIYLDKGYANLKTFTYPDSQGNNKTTQQLYWTEKGKEFIIELINKLKNAA